MTTPTRQHLVNSGHLVFQKPVSQRNDLLDTTLTKTGLVALACDLFLPEKKGYYFEVTAVKSDHHDDRDLGELCHYNGYCMDGWPLNSPKPGDYMDPNSARFAQFCHDAGFDPYDHQVGLAGSAVTHANVTAAGAGYFQDDGGDHIHLGARSV